MRVPPFRKRALAIAITTFALALSFAPTTGTGQHSPTYLATPHSYSAPLTPQSALRIPHSAQAAPLSTRSSGSIYFRQTGHYLKDAFLNYWLMNGGVNIYGYPISEEFTFNGVAMQYFERARFEYHPNSARPWKVELSNVGSMLTEGRDFPNADPANVQANRTYFEQTGHTLGGAFAQFWKASGDVAIFGYPISEEIVEGGTTVQYFERARFELTAQGRVQLGHVGSELLKKYQVLTVDASQAAPQTRPGFSMSFRGEATVFNANWDRVISLNKSWGNLPQDFVGYGLYAAAPADLYLYGRWARVTRGNRSIYVQFIDVINWPDIPYVRNKGIVIDLGQEAYEALGQYGGGRYEVSFDVFWPEEEPNR